MHLPNKPRVHRKCAIKNVEAIITKCGKQLSVPLETKTKNGDHVMLNIHRDNQGRIDSFKLSGQNIKHEHLPCDGVWYLFFNAKG